MRQRLYAWLWRHPRIHIELYELTGFFVMGRLPREVGERYTQFSLHRGR